MAGGVNTRGEPANGSVMRLRFLENDHSLAPNHYQKLIPCLHTQRLASLSSDHYLVS
jgi:hypothetical protein